MGTITSGIGPFSGINSAQLIDQLIQADSGPKVLAQQRIVSLQAQQAAYLDLSSRVNALFTAAGKFNLNHIFDSVLAASSAPDSLQATATTSAVPGAYQFLVDRVVSSQQILTRGFADRATTGIGASAFTFESAAGRLDRDVSLTDLNGGQGISRGKIVVTDSTGTATTVDLSRVGTVSEVLDAINSAGNGKFTAAVQGDKFILTDSAGGTGRLSVGNATGYTTATSLGIAGQAASAGSGGAITGSRVYSLGLGTTLQSLNDGNGIRINTAAGNSNPDFTIHTHAGDSLSIDIGDLYDTHGVKTASAVSTVQGLIDRINTQSAGKVTAAISADGSGITLTDTTSGSDNFTITDLASSGAATDLGIVADTAGATVTSKRLIAALNSTLAANLNGGAGLTAGDLSITDRAGVQHSITLPTTGSVSDLIDAIRTQTGGAVTAALDQTGTGLQLTDTTGGAGNLIVAGGGATALGLATDPAGVASSTVRGGRLQHRYVSLSTALSSLNGGTGVGTGSFEIVNSSGQRATINVGAGDRTVGDLVAHINATSIHVHARINDHGDGILIEDTNTPPGPSKLKITDTSGTVAKSLNLAGEASGTGADNHIDGSYEKTVAFTAADTLDAVVQKINNANVPVTATVINDGTGSSPFRLSLASKLSGEGGRFTLDTGALDLSPQTLSAGEDARLFYGAADPARGVLLSSTTNIFDGVVNGVRIDAKSPSTTPVTLTVSRDTDSIISAINDFITAFNNVVSRIDTLTSYDADTQKKGTLLGDGTVEGLRGQLFDVLQSRAQGVSGSFQFLSQVGIKVASGGQLTLDTDALRTALNQDPQGVEDLFAAKVPTPRPTPVPGQPVPPPVPPDQQTYVSLGVAEQIARLADQFGNSATGIFKAKKDAFDAQIKLQTDRIADLNKQLDNKRQVLQQQFLAMEQAIGAMQSQQSALAGLAARTG